MLSAFAEKTDLPGQIVAHLPYMTVTGFGEISIDLQQGLVSYSDAEIVVKVSLGTVCVQGSGLHITLMRDGRITIRGELTGVILCRETEL
jgi:sporulation protein YqfC